MALVNQDTYDEVVEENIREFEMTKEEAVEEAVKQFQAQGADLSNVVKGLCLQPPKDAKRVAEAVALLNELAKASDRLSRAEECLEQLAALREECELSLDHRVSVGKQGAYSAILGLMAAAYADSAAVSVACLKALTALMTKQPDLLDERGSDLAIALSRDGESEEVLVALFAWVQECCTMHEANRQAFFDAGIVDSLKRRLDDGGAGPALTCAVLGVLRSLVLDDDVRVEFGRAHDHAKAIASDALPLLTQLLSKFKGDEQVVSDLLVTIPALLVRTEFCEKFVEVGGLKVLKDLMVTFYDNDKLSRHCFKLLKSLAGNDECKAKIIGCGLAPVITSTLSRHKASKPTASIGLWCVSALTLRSPDNSKAMFESGIAEVIVGCMKLHPNDASVQKNGSWAVRNMVSRSRYQAQAFLDLDVESVLKANLAKFKKFEYDTKSALRDLGCDVKLNEEWTGKGGLIYTQATGS